MFWARGQAAFQALQEPRALCKAGAAFLRGQVVPTQQDTGWGAGLGRGI